MNIRGLQFKTVLLMGCAMAVALAVALYSLARVYGSMRELDRISHEDFQTQLESHQINDLDVKSPVIACNPAPDGRALVKVL